MANVKPQYISNNNAIAFTGLSTLANGVTTWSPTISNTTNLDVDHLPAGTFTTGSGATSTGTINIVVAASSDGGTTYPTNVANCKPLAVLTANVASTVFQVDPVSVAAWYGGQLPENYKIGITNSTGAALTAGSMWYEREGTTIA